MVFSISRTANAAFPALKIVVDKGICALFGPSGLGKTHLLHQIAGLKQLPEGSEISLDGCIWLDNNICVPTHSRRLAMVFQHSELFEHVNVYDNIIFAKRVQSSCMSDDELEDLLEQLGIKKSLLNKSIEQLSGGERQRISMARALFSKPQLLLLDEPVSALDKDARRVILRAVRNYQQASACRVIFVTHQLEEVAFLADNLVVFNAAGEILSQGSAIELSSRIESGLCQLDNGGAIIEGRLKGQESPYPMSRIAVGEQSILIPLLDAAPQSMVRLHIAARDISIALDRPNNSSILNCFAVRITDIEQCQHYALVRVAFEDQFLLSRITLKSLHDLKLNVGMHVFAQVKSVALMR